MERLTSVLGIIVLLMIGFLLSNNKKKIPWRILIWGLGLQIIFGILFLPNSFFNETIVNNTGMEQGPGAYVFFVLQKGISTMISQVQRSLDFLYHPFAMNSLPAEWQQYLPFTFKNMLFYSLPTIIFFSALMAILYHWGVLQKLVQGVSWVMKKTMKISGAESLAAASNIFIGMIEAPLVIKPYVSKMTKSELFCLMCGGFATIAGTVMGIYMSFFKEANPELVGHLVSASVMSAPAAIMFAKIIYPETETPETSGRIKVRFDKDTTSTMDALSKGAITGITLLLNVVAMLIAVLAILAVLNYPLEQLFGIRLEGIAGYIFTPIAWVIGVPWEDCYEVGQLMGYKIFVNELIAYSDLANKLSPDMSVQLEMLNQINPHLGMALGTDQQVDQILNARSALISTYALCGFANFSSIGIMIGGLSAITPERRAEIAKLGMKAMIGGALSSFLTATLAGLIAYGV